jgi:mono/diheme cytochrome c family protein
MAMNLDPKPPNLHETHVQENSDGSLFYLTSEVEGTSMPAFKKSLSEQDIWHLVNYMRTFEIEGGEADDHDDDHEH